MRKRVKNATIHLRYAGVIISIITIMTLSSCPAPFDMDNPVDPAAESYQGFDTVDYPNEVTAYTKDGAEITWLEFTISEVEGADSYELEIAEDENFNTKVYSASDGSFSESVMKPKVNLTAGNTYYWHGRAIKNDTPGEWTQTRSFTMKNMADSMSPADGSTTTDTTPTLSWDAVTEAVSYEVQIADSEAEVESATAIESASAEYTPSTSLSKNQSHYWRVRAVNGDGVATAWSSIYRLSVSWGEITGMRPADGTTTADTTPTLSWDAVTEAVSYEVQIADSEAEVESATAIESASAEYTPSTSLSKNQSHYWRVRAVNGDGVATAWSNTKAINLTDTPSVGDYGQAGGIVYYDKGSYSDGWQYLEAAPAETEWEWKEWGDWGKVIGGDAQLTGIGDGQAATNAIVQHLNNNTSETGRAAQLCAGLEHNGYSDWFLPSKDELNKMYENLYYAGIGGFASYPYWSSSEASSYNAWRQHFGDGYRSHYDKFYNDRVRASRAF